MENMYEQGTVPKWVLINWPKIPQMPHNLSAQIVCPSPKIWDFDEKKRPQSVAQSVELSVWNMTWRKALSICLVFTTDCSPGLIFQFRLLLSQVCSLTILACLTIHFIQTICFLCCAQLCFCMQFSCISTQGRNARQISNCL